MIEEAKVTEVRAGGFTPKATEFFAGLERDNSKDYWTANKGVFENEVKEPMAALVESLSWCRRFMLSRACVIPSRARVFTSSASA